MRLVRKAFLGGAAVTISMLATGVSAQDVLPEVRVEQKQAKPARRPQRAQPVQAQPRRARVVRARPVPKAVETPPEPSQQELEAAALADPQPGQPGSATGPVEGYIAGASETGTKTDTPLQEVPQSVSVVGAEQIREQGSQTLEQSVRYSAGVYASPFGFDGRGDYPVVRGSLATQFLDGMKRSFYFYDFAKPDPYALERIEILRGPASMLYGQHTTGGLINLISKRPQRVPYREIGFEYGSFGETQLQTDMTGPLTADGKWLYRLVAVGRESGTQVNFTNDDRKLLAPSITWLPNDKTSFTVLGDWQEDDASPNTLQFLPREGSLVPGPNGRISRSLNPGNPDFDDYLPERKSIATLFDHEITDWLSVHSSMRYTDFSIDTRGMYPSIFGVADPYIDPQRRNVFREVYTSDLVGEIFTTDNRAVLSVNTGPIEHKFVSGYDFTRYDQFEDFRIYTDMTPFDLYSPRYTNTVSPRQMGVPPSITDITQYQRGAYVQDQMRFGPLIGTVGFRHDRAVNKNNDAPPAQDSEANTQRYALMYETAFGLNPYVAYSGAFTPVVGADRFGNFFNPLEGEQIEAGFKYQVNKHLLLNGAVFQINEFNRLSSDPADPLNTLQLGEVEITGGEIEMIFSTDRWNVIAAYSYTDAKIVAGDNIGLRPESVPDHLASLWLIRRFGLWGVDGFSIGGGVRHVGSTGNGDFKSPSFTLFDAVIGWENEKWRWQLNGNNLEDERFITGCRFPTGPDCFYGMARNYTTSLTYKF